MIPKIIHYVWVGGADKPRDIQRCIDSWKRKLSDFKFMEWNERNFPVEKFPFAKRAFEERKWAFVSDLIRVAVMYEYGGVYLDCDVKIIKDLSPFLNEKLFIGFEDDAHPSTAVFGAEPMHPLFKDIMNFYNSIDLSKQIDFQQFVNTTIFSKVLIRDFKCRPDGKEQMLDTGIHVYPSSSFCYPSFHSIAVHVFLGSWLKENGTTFSRFKEWWRLSLSSQFQCWVYSVFMIFIYRLILHKDDHRR
ncbi:glycosyltransferase family 32 protein [Lacticaseibacillus rhamnosus]|uniref:glycosyltransferase family 32 protein n=1 Tax=Lacticaseibacillus rhamnosus TaxID=47715 RepID=UPI00062A1C91|nr:glycosyltransferase [Lacticaseibacillus rhamnosus]KKW88831.1 hypothetical protein XA20_00010 [Lacticaseibacillus rhamnosus]PTM25440.1 glycosyl transferase [Lacticaseibacillus rhamnosus]